MVLFHKTISRVSSCCCLAHDCHLFAYPRRASTTSLPRGNNVGHDNGEDLTWPARTAGNRVPTPYQILKAEPGCRYSKEEFFRLVKIYHPDRCEQPHASKSFGGLSHATRTERYRLVVAAHEILADPVRRAAYDCNGEGWESQAAAAPRQWTYSSRDQGNPDSPFRNATWEDWERWYKRNDQRPQSPVFVSNAAFAAFILALAVVGTAIQSARVGHYSANFLEQEQHLHGMMSQDLVQRRKERKPRDDRINAFLHEREAWAYSRLEAGGQDYDKPLPAPEICSAEQVRRGKG